MTVAIAFLLAGLVLALTVWAVRFIATGPPPEPVLDEIHEVDVPYVCSVCGMSLTVTQAQGDDIEPPRHCRENMIRA